jgi:hypothetical protein
MKFRPGIFLLGLLMAPLWGTMKDKYEEVTAVPQPPIGTGVEGAWLVGSHIECDRDMHFTDLTLIPGGSIDTKGHRIYVRGTLDLSQADGASIHWERIQSPSLLK